MATVQFGSVSADMRLVDEGYGIPALQGWISFLESFDPVSVETVSASSDYAALRMYDVNGTFMTVSIFGDLQLGQISETRIEAAGVIATLAGSFQVSAYGEIFGTANEMRADLVDGSSLVRFSDFNAASYNFLLDVSDEDLLSLADGVSSGSGADYLLGYGGNDTLYAGSGNDTLDGGAGDDTLDGGAGFDTGTYGRQLAQYTINKWSGGYTVQDKSGADGTDTLVNIEAAKFADLTVNLTVQAQAAAAPQADVQRLSELYIAFFNRVPDADGLSYWISQKVAGQSIDQIAESFYNAGVQYPSLTGFSSSMSNADFVNVVYRNVLGRADGADPDGLVYWTTELASGRASHGSLVSTILDSAHTFKGDPTWGWVADLLDNKIAIAHTFAVNWGLNYNTPEDSISHGMAIAAAITPTGIDAAISLIGISDADINLG